MGSDHPIEWPGSQGAEALFAAFQAGSLALARLLELHRPYLLKIVHEESDPGFRARFGQSDLVQEAFIDVLNHLKGTTKGLFAVEDQDDLRAWLRRVGLNAMKSEQRDQCAGPRDLHREQSLEDGAEGSSGSSTPSSLFMEQERKDAIETALNELPEADRMLFRLKILHGWTYLELAAILDGQQGENDAGRMRVTRRLTGLALKLSAQNKLLEFLD